MKNFSEAAASSRRWRRARPARCESAVRGDTRSRSRIRWRAAGLRLRRICGARARCATPTPAEPVAEFRRNVLGTWLSPAAAVAHGNRAVDEDQHVEPAREVAGVERLRKHDLERELELLEEPSRPPGRHRSAVGVPQADPHRAQLDRRAIAARDAAIASNRQPLVRGHLLQNRQRRRLRRRDDRAGRIGPPARSKVRAARETSSFAFSRRFTATKASFTSVPSRYPPPCGAAVTRPRRRPDHVATFSNGPSKPSRMRSNTMPIE